MDRDDLVERVAKALCREDIRFGAEPWIDLPDKNVIGISRDWYYSLARAALAIMEPTVRETCARTAEAWEISAGVEGEARTARGIAAAIRAGAEP